MPACYNLYSQFECQINEALKSYDFLGPALGAGMILGIAAPPFIAAGAVFYNLLVRRQR